MPAAETVPAASSIVIVPAVPPLPMAAVSPVSQNESVAPLDQFASAVVFQLPLPSLGAPGLAGLASQVRMPPKVGMGKADNAAAVAAAEIARNLPRPAERRRRFTLCMS